MAIRFVCPYGHPLIVPDQRAGKKGRCPVCHQRVYVPVANPKPSGQAKPQPGEWHIELDAASADAHSVPPGRSVPEPRPLPVPVRGARDLDAILEAELGIEPEASEVQPVRLAPLSSAHPARTFYRHPSPTPIVQPKPIVQSTSTPSPTSMPLAAPVAKPTAVAQPSGPPLSTSPHSPAPLVTFEPIEEPPLVETESPVNEHHGTPAMSSLDSPERDVDTLVTHASVWNEPSPPVASALPVASVQPVAGLQPISTTPSAPVPPAPLYAAPVPMSTVPVASQKTAAPAPITPSAPGSVAMPGRWSTLGQPTLAPQATNAAPMPPLASIAHRTRVEGWWNVATAETVSAGMLPDPGWRQTMLTLSAVMVGLALFGASPAFGRLELGTSPGWVALLLLGTLVEIALAGWLLSVPDWSAMRVGLAGCTLIAALYAGGATLVLSQSPAHVLPLGLNGVRNTAGGWCMANVLLWSVLAYAYGRSGGQWRREWRRGLLAN